MYRVFICGGETQTLSACQLTKPLLHTHTPPPPANSPSLEESAAMLRARVFAFQMWVICTFFRGWRQLYLVFHTGQIPFKPPGFQGPG